MERSGFSGLLRVLKTGSSSAPGGPEHDAPICESNRRPGRRNRESVCVCHTDLLSVTAKNRPQQPRFGKKLRKKKKDKQTKSKLPQKYYVKDETKKEERGLCPVTCVAHVKGEQ